ncbi:hypothetical protein V6N13_026791 [Hibiscus sabdariffa]
MYRPIPSPGWTLGWTWAKKEVIWSMVGAEAIDQGDCSDFKTNIPHSCERSPAIIDLLPGRVPENQQFPGCCKGGVLSSHGLDKGGSVSSSSRAFRRGSETSTDSKPNSVANGEAQPAAMHATYVPNPGPLAFQGELQEVLACEDESGVLYGSELLMGARNGGNVHSEMILGKDEEFRLDGGWGFPRKIYFNGDECLMPSPDSYPFLPKPPSLIQPSLFAVALLFILLAFSSFWCGYKITTQKTKTKALLLS